ncbi:hypothetical protein CY658_04985 [Variovorax sp. RO1]|uniref:phage protein NinX family protein n=1 Tax=Variovorax sp. RO1 TaxID=2066034 RepID=UPI000C717225|nr:phage protein NinX family protein [Variovorax sp. RO1]PLC06392.1 hypothetical protein CY658_04985 [Variovorax sp. RO1]
MKTSELTGAQLDYWVAKAEGHRVRLVGELVVFYEGGDDSGLKERRGPEFSPSTDWSDGGPIIERERIGVWSGVDPYSGKSADALWFSEGSGTSSGRAKATGPSSLVAAMRAYVASKFGEDFPGDAG